MMFNRWGGRNVLSARRSVRGCLVLDGGVQGWLVLDGGGPTDGVYQIGAQSLEERYPGVDVVLIESVTVQLLSAAGQ
jgi:hypothetical protein